MNTGGPTYALLLVGLAGAVAFGVFLGYALALRYRGQIAAQAIVDALPVLTQRVQIELLPPARLRVPAYLEIHAHVPTMEPITIPVEVLPAPTNVELARRILAEAPTIGVRQLARILDVAPSSAHALVQTLRPESLHDPDAEAALSPVDAGRATHDG